MSYAPPCLPPLEFSVRGARSAMVLDPAVLLCHPASAVLVQKLAKVLDLWVPPSLWRLLDASEFYSPNPHALVQWLGLPDLGSQVQAGSALQLWARLRLQRDVGHMDLYWVHDSQSDAYLPEPTPRDLPLRFEALAQALQATTGETEPVDASSGLVDMACECAALAVGLGSVPLLTLASAVPGQPPRLAQAL